MNIKSTLKYIQTQLNDCEKAYNRATDSVALLAVSKTRSVSEIQEAINCGQLFFGENYAQEGVEKIKTIHNLAVQWHFIGPLQSNKCRLIAEHFAWVQSVDRAKIAEKLNASRPATLPSLNICLQVNISGEDSKSGILPNELCSLAETVAQLPKLRLRGLMAIPAPADTFAEQYQAFLQMQQLFGELKQRGYALDTLSMGMSDDFPAAIAAGATMVRIGSAIFGPRNKE